VRSPGRLLLRYISTLFWLLVAEGLLAATPQIIGFSHSAGVSSITFSSLPQATYQLERTFSLTVPQWEFITLSDGHASNLIFSSGNTTHVTDLFQDGGGNPLTAPSAFYRVTQTKPNNGGVSCAQAVNLGSINGSINSGTFCPSSCTPGPVQTGVGSTWYMIRLLENGNCTAPLRLDARLVVPSGIDYDLYVYNNCATVVASSHLDTGVTENVFVTVSDNVGSDDSVTFLIEVRYFAGYSQSGWTLLTSGGNGPCY
jgi:hypothetical protein